MSIIIVAPAIDIRYPAIFNPNVASFWSPKLNAFLVIVLASYINITPIRANMLPTNLIIISHFFVPFVKKILPYTYIQKFVLVLIQLNLVFV